MKKSKNCYASPSSRVLRETLYALREVRPERGGCEGATFVVCLGCLRYWIVRGMYVKVLQVALNIQVVAECFR